MGALPRTPLAMVATESLKLRGYLAQSHSSHAKTIQTTARDQPMASDIRIQSEKKQKKPSHLIWKCQVDIFNLYLCQANMRGLMETDYGPTQNTHTVCVCVCVCTCVHTDGVWWCVSSCKTISNVYLAK